jgi:hypothetical protein
MHPFVVKMEVILFILFLIQSGLIVTGVILSTFQTVLCLVKSGYIITAKTLSMITAMAELARPVSVFSITATLPAIVRLENLWFLAKIVVIVYMVVATIFIVTWAIFAIVTEVPLVIRNFKRSGLSIGVDAYIYIGVNAFFLFCGSILFHNPMVSEFASLVVSLAPTLPSVETVVTYIVYLTFVVYKSIEVVVNVIAVISVIVYGLPLVIKDSKRSGLSLSEDAYILIVANAFAVVLSWILYNIPTMSEWPGQIVSLVTTQYSTAMLVIRAKTAAHHEKKCLKRSTTFLRRTRSLVRKPTSLLKRTRNP